MATVLNLSVNEIDIMPYTELLGYYNLESKQAKERVNNLKKIQKK